MIFCISLYSKYKVYNYLCTYEASENGLRGKCVIQ